MNDCCETCHTLLKQLVDLQAACTSALQAQQRNSIPKYLQQARQYQNAATAITMSYHTQSQVLLRVTTIIVVVTSAATLVIGDRSWPVNGFAVLDLGDDGILIRPEDVCTLTQTTAGAMGLEFFGQEMADRGGRW